MIIIPSINKTNFLEVEKQLEQVHKIGADWAHIDVSDGKFAKHVSWNKPEKCQVSGVKYQVKTEIHLMVENPDEVLGRWIEAGANRVIVHVESAKNIVHMKELCDRFGVEFGVAINPKTVVKKLFDYPDIKFFLILAVKPGPSGQKFDDKQIDRIKVLRAKLSDVKIEVDGGINGKNAPEIKKAGADIIVSGSYIWSNKNPQTAYKKLTICD